MALREAIVGGAVGGLAGALTAYVTAKGKINAIRAEFEGKLQEVQLRRTHEIEDRTEASSAAVVDAARKRAGDLRLAASHLISALNDPDSMHYNVKQAQEEVNAATAAVPGEASDLSDLARRLQRASNDRDGREAEAVLQLLSEIGS